MYLYKHPLSSLHSVIECIQISNDDDTAPILAPDIQQCPQRGPNFDINYKSNEEAKIAYRYVINTLKKDKKQRKYLFGSRYNNIFHDKR